VTRRSPALGQSLALGPGPEFDRIREIVRLLGPQAGTLGDDCALLPADHGFLALSTDVSVERVHFRLDWLRFAEVGWRATAAALSDLAAEGADPAGVLCALTLPADAAHSDLLDVMSGVGAAATSAGASVLGGDLSAGAAWSLAVTVVGKTERPVTRCGAEPGDQIWVTGRLGGSRAALEAWRRGEEPLPGARERFARPEPRIAAGRWLAGRGAHAMIDLSDGLAGDSGHLAAASGVALEIDLSSVPVAWEAQIEAERRGIPPQQFAAEAGEDFELLVVLDRQFDGAADFFRHAGIPLTRIGRVALGQGARFILGDRSISLEGFNHFG
jgi:thiamine-monophosphate kinase